MLRAGTAPAAGRRTPVLVALLLVAAVLATPLWLGGTGARASSPVGPCENTSVCVGASTPPHGGKHKGGGGGGGGGVEVCTYRGTTEPCTTAYGTFDPDDGCYYQEVQPQPPAGDPDWHGHAPGDGAVYSQTCPYAPGGGGSSDIWLAAAPAGPPVVTPAQLAQQALAEIHRTAATVRTAPDAGGARTALVGSPIWLWLRIDRTGTDYATRANALTATAAVPGLSVTAIVYATSVDWNMGDDGSATTCTGPGTEYHASDGAAPSPDCGYSYAEPSIGQADERYAITATVHWTARWTAKAGGRIVARGTVPLDPIATPATTLRVSELQVLN